MLCRIEEYAGLERDEEVVHPGGAGSFPSSKLVEYSKPFFEGRRERAYLIAILQEQNLHGCSGHITFRIHPNNIPPLEAILFAMNETEAATTLL